MDLPTSGWKNKIRARKIHCKCGSWKDHWINNSKSPWPLLCSISGCWQSPTLGIHIRNRNVKGEYIVPACDRCRWIIDEFNLKPGVAIVPAKKQLACS